MTAPNLRATIWHFRTLTGPPVHRYDAAAMIRFQCASCHQPIEIDAEWALKAVACPYCKKTVTAPAASTIGQDEAIPLAAPLAAGAPLPASLDPSTANQQFDAGDPRIQPGNHRDSDGNPIAIVALALMLSATACLIVLFVIAAKHPGELTALKEYVEQASTWKQQADATMEFLDEQGGLPTWLIGFSLAQFGCLILTVAALICGLLGLRRRSRRAPAAIAVALSGGLMLLLCSGLVL